MNTANHSHLSFHVNNIAKTRGLNARGTPRNLCSQHSVVTGKPNQICVKMESFGLMIVPGQCQTGSGALKESNSKTEMYKDLLLSVSWFPPCLNALKKERR